ncbi:hypothetical protein DFR42_103467 [Undibacterium pigrum]|uniref:Uncharacterized protein n=1 Tax=Undibacterium pigrum TaxID=401470 RepID=A0A318JUP4_9BURK|nr:hypothetical protein DFR42_103467 [Undibacterium pigrum]
MRKPLVINVLYVSLPLIFSVSPLCLGVSVVNGFELIQEIL